MMASNNLAADVGRNFTSDWRQVTQDEIGAYTRATRDGTDEWIHLDPVRAAAETLYGGTIVQGFFQAAMLTDLCSNAVKSNVDINHALNYGFDRLRFVSPLPVGAHVRAELSVIAVVSKGDGVLVTYHVELHCRETNSVTLAADWLFYVGHAGLKLAE